MGKPLFLTSTCLGCRQVWRVEMDFCPKCGTGQWITDEWLEAENE
jgi:RNA polymerase subunit RPABC4/transcription elongation factor Spt4